MKELVVYVDNSMSIDGQFRAPDPEILKRFGIRPRRRVTGVDAAMPDHFTMRGTAVTVWNEGAFNVTGRREDEAA